MVVRTSNTATPVRQLNAGHRLLAQGQLTCCEWRSPVYVEICKLKTAGVSEKQIILRIKPHAVDIELKKQTPNKASNDTLSKTFEFLTTIGDSPDATEPCHPEYKVISRTK